MTELEIVAQQINAAVSYLDVFGQIEGDATAQTNQVRSIYRKLTRAVHPDRFATADDRATAQVAFVRLTALKQDAIAAIANDRYGTDSVMATIHTKKHTYRVLSRVGADSITEWFTAERAGSTLYLHIAKQPTMNTLVVNEASVLRKLYASDPDITYRPYLPVLEDRFVYRKDGASRSALVFNRTERLVSLEAVKTRVGRPIHPLDMAWMWRRLLVPIGFAHRSGIVHGAVLPPNIYIEPQNHGLVLAGWYSAVMSDTTHYPAVTTGLAQYKTWYPKEVIEKQPVSPATDIAMAAKTMAWLMGGDLSTGTLPDMIPSPIRAFFRGCLQAQPQARPQDAWALINDFDELLEHLGRPYWPRRFRPFTALSI